MLIAEAIKASEMASQLIKAPAKNASSGLELAWSQVSATTDHQIDYAVENGFRKFIDIVPEDIVIYQNHRIIYANQVAVKRRAATSPTDLLGRRGFDFVAPGDRRRLAAVLRQLREPGSQSDLTRINQVGLDGHPTVVEAIAVVILWGGQPAVLSLSRDITHRMQAEARLESFLSTAAHWLWETDANHRFVFSTADLDRHGFTIEHVRGKTRWELAGVSPDCDARWREHMSRLHARQPFDDFILKTIETNGDVLYRSVSGMPVFDTEGAFKGYRGTARDVTEEKQAEQTIEHMALHDTLTELPNRACCKIEIERIYETAQCDGKQFAVLFLDLDNFKSINDSHGHSVGDRLLIEVAGRLKSSLDDGDFVARFGGDEFVAVTTRSTDITSIRRLVDSIIGAIAVRFDIDDLSIHTSISIGVALFPDDGDDTERVLANADLALFAAKKAGRNTWQIFDRRLREQLHARQSLDVGLRHALERRQFELVYQPLINIADRSIKGFEALVRWNNPKSGQILPEAFIPAMERNRLIGPLTEWVIQEATSQLQRWMKAGLDSFGIAINISPSLLKVKGFVELVDYYLHETGCHPELVTVEITEEALINEAEVTRILIALKERGLQIAADDFGTGYSSMTHLKSLPIDILKIDRSFLANVAIDPTNATIVESIVNVGQCLGKTVVAEGIETSEQLSFLEKIGCDVAQGFLVSRPMPAANVPVWFEHWRSSKQLSTSLLEYT